MRFSSKINKYEASVKKLERELAKSCGYCPVCRLLGRGWWAVPQFSRPRSKHIVEAKCDYCHLNFNVDFSCYTEDERKALRLHYSFTQEDRYTNPVAHAITIWLKYRMKQINGITPQQQSVTPRRSRKGGMDRRLFAQLREEINIWKERESKRLFDKYGGPPFPGHQDLVKVGRAKAIMGRKTGAYVNGLHALEAELIPYMICAELEREIIWGEVLPETKSAIEKIELAMDELINALEAEEAEKKRAKEAEQRRAEEAAKERRNTESRKKIDLENRHRRQLKMPLLPDDYEGSLTSFPELIKMSRHDNVRRLY